MKKILTLILIFVFCFSLAGCGENDKKPSGASAIEEFVKSGTMTDCEFSLGDSYSDVLSTLEKAAEENEEEGHEHEEFFVLDDDTEKIIDTSTHKYYFDISTDKLYCIVSFGDAYGFSHGTVISELKSQMEENGYEATVQSISADEAFFLYGVGEREVLKYTFGDNTVMFVFEENALCATMLSEK